MAQQNAPSTGLNLEAWRQDGPAIGCRALWHGTRTFAERLSLVRSDVERLHEALHSALDHFISSTFDALDDSAQAGLDLSVLDHFALRHERVASRTNALAIEDQLRRQLDSSSDPPTAGPTTRKQCFQENAVQRRRSVDVVREVVVLFGQFCSAPTTHTC